MPDDLYSVPLSRRDIQLIKESLLNCVSSNLTHTSYWEDLMDMAKLVVKLRMAHQDIFTENLISCKGDKCFSDGITDSILAYFPEL